jgi:hypothetical protein
MMPGASHAFSAKVRTANTTGAIVQAWLQWVDASGTKLIPSKGSTVTLSTVNTWMSVNVVGIPPANAAGCAAQIIMTNSVAFHCDSDMWQVELGSAPTSWVQPGVWY